MPITSAKLASPSERERALGIGSFGARYRECQRGAPEPVRDRFRAEVTGAGAPAGSLERVDEGGINRVLRAWDGLDLPDRLPEIGRLLEDLVDRARVRPRAVVLLALRERPERDVLHRGLDLGRGLAEVVVDVGERLARVLLDQAHRVGVGGDEGLHLAGVLPTKLGANATWSVMIVGYCFV